MGVPAYIIQDRAPETLFIAAHEPPSAELEEQDKQTLHQWMHLTITVIDRHEK